MNKYLLLGLGVLVLVGVLLFSNNFKGGDAQLSQTVSGPGTPPSSQLTIVDAPRNLQTAVKSKNSILVEWDVPINPTGITKYEIEWGVTAYTSSAILLATDETKFLIGQNTTSNPFLADGSKILVRIRSLDASGASSTFVDMADQLTTAFLSGSPTKPGNASASNITSSSASLAWNPSTDPSNYVKYYVEEYKGNKLVQILCVSDWNDPSCDATGLSSNTKYTVKVKAMNIDGISLYNVSLTQPPKAQIWTIGNASSFTTQ